MDFQSLLERKLEPVGKSSKDIIYRCPQCEGSEGSGHLYVDYDKGYFHCFKCNFSGKRIEALLKFLHIDIDYDYSKLYSEKDKELDDIIGIRKQKKVTAVCPVEYSTDLKILTEYYLHHTAPLSETAYNYLLNRGLSDNTIDRLLIREGVNRYGQDVLCQGQSIPGRDYSGRIMVPSLRNDGLISFYVGRDYTGMKEPKYLNSTKELAVASEDVWLLDIIETPSVIICEGVFTAIAINQALGKIIACATYGKSIAQNSSTDKVRATSQGEKLLSRNFDQYIIFYDKDARSDAINTAKYLYERGATVKVVLIDTDKYGPKADAADMTREEIIEHIRDSVLYDRFTGLV